MVRKSDKRKFNHKSKVGCTTCKRRRVKYDETKPFCNRYRKLGICCEGYQFLTSINDGRLERPSERGSVFSGHSTIPGLDEVDSYLTWDGLTDRQCYDGSAVRAVLAAIGATHKALEVEAISAERERRASEPTPGIVGKHGLPFDAADPCRASIARARAAAAEHYRRALSITSRTPAMSF